VRSFKSFIQTVPPNPGVNSQKPLPPTPSPTSPEAHISSQLVVAPPTNRATIVAPWNEPTEWNWDVPSPIIPPTNAASISTTDQYFPLLPGPSPVTTGIAGGISTEMVDTDEAQQTVSDLEWGTMGKRPEPPPRNPSRLSMYGRLSEPSGSASSTASVLRDNQPSLSPGSKSEDYSDQSTTHRSDIGIAAPPDLSYIASYTSKKPKPFASLDTGTKHGHSIWKAQSDESVHRYLLLRGKSFSPFIRGDLLVPDETEEPGLDDRLQQLGYSQDYHSVLTSQYHDRNLQRTEASVDPLSRPTIPKHETGVGLKTVNRDQEMIPQPLAWRKSSDSSSSRRYSSRRRFNAHRTHISRPKKMHDKMKSWIPLQQLYNGGRRASTIEGDLSNSAEENITPRPALISGFPEITASKKTSHFPDLIAHAKGIKSHKYFSKSNDLSPQPSMSQAVPQPQQSKAPLLRLPGGLALVRRSPSSTSHPNTKPLLQSPPTIDTQRQDLGAVSQFPPSMRFRRPSSSYSQSSTTSPVSPIIAMGRKMRNSVYSLPFARPRSENSSLSTSPHVQEMIFPRPPDLSLPRKRTKAPKTFLPVSLPKLGSEKPFLKNAGDDQTADQGLHKPGILDKARDVRDAWRKHQKEVKHEKLKQSIKLVGPIDVANTDRHSKREGRVLVESDLQRRIPGYIIPNPL